MGYLDEIFNEAKKDRIAGDFPFSLGVEVTNHCNLRCPMCPREIADRGFANMSWELYEKIVEQCIGQERLLFLPQGFGESFIHPEFGKMLRYAHEKGIALIMVVSNGTYLSDKNIHKLIDSQVPFVNVSLDGTDKEIYEQIRVNANHEEVIANVKRLFELREERQSDVPYVILRMIKMDQTVDDVDTFIDYWQPYLKEHDEIAFSNYQTWNNSVEDKRTETPQGMVELEEIKNRDESPPPCRMIYKTAQIFHDGSTTPCCYDYNCSMNIGNANEESISAIWTGAKAKHFRRLHEEGRINEIPICNGCQEYIP